MSRCIDVLCNAITSTCDAAGRRKSVADGTTKTYEYDLAGRLTESTDQNGSVITSTYDAASRVTGRTVNRAAGIIGTTEQTFTYDAAGRLLSSTDNNDPADDAQVTRSYDALGRTTAETVNGNTVTSSYTGSYRTGITYPNGTGTCKFGRDGGDVVCMGGTVNGCERPDKSAFFPSK